MVSLKRILKMAFLSFRRNGWLSVAATLIMVLTLFTISMFFIISFILNSSIKIINEKMDFSVYLKDEAAFREVDSLKIRLSNMANVKEVCYVSKKEALEIYREKNKSRQELLEPFPEKENPLPASLEIKVLDPGKMDEIVSILEESQYKPIVSKISYHESRETIKKLTSMTSYVKKVGLALSIVFIAIAILIIFNTIRIAIYARRDEIEIMQLVGATSWFVRGPFVFEAMFYGIIATIVNFFLFYPILYVISQSSVRYVGEYGSNPFIFYNQNLVLILPAQLILGIFLGVISSLIALRKYLE
jgi:cell division transport system permease protein